MSSPLDLYASSNWGPMKLAPFNGSAGAAIRYKITPPAGQAKALFVIRASQAFRILQSPLATIVVTATTGGQGDANKEYPITVERGKNQFISILSATVTATSLEVKIDSSTDDWSLDVA